MQKGKKTKIIGWSSALLFLLILLAVVLGVTLGKRSHKNDSENQAAGASKVISAACQHTLYPSLCEASLLDSAPPQQQLEQNQVVGLSLRVAIDNVNKALSHARKYSKVDQPPPEQYVYSGMDDCAELLDDTLQLLNDAVRRNNDGAKEDVRAWLAAALTNLDTCIDGVNTFNIQDGRDTMKSLAWNGSQYISNSLALHQQYGPDNNGRKLGEEKGKIPSWVNRRLLQTPVWQLRPHVVVAKDGSGQCDTVEKAVAMARGGEERFVIYVKEGVYRENVVVKRSQTNVFLVGDGKGRTIITGSRSAANGWTTFRSATFAVSGSGFVARDITFSNEAGGENGQAVALRVSSDKSAIFRCSVSGHQDTLYAHRGRQFYRETDVHGSVDFILGNAAAVFQNCDLLARKPHRGLKVTVTAQSRTDPNQNTGFSIQNCRLGPDTEEDFNSGEQQDGQYRRAGAYLGRPWKEYSRVVVMRSTLDAFVDPAGWLEWSGNFGLNTLFYAESMNTGGGAGTSGRVHWAGYHPNLSQTEAAKFTVSDFLEGTTWLARTEVAYDPGLF